MVDTTNNNINKAILLKERPIKSLIRSLIRSNLLNPLHSNTLVFLISKHKCNSSLRIQICRLSPPNRNLQQPQPLMSKNTSQEVQMET